MSLTHTITRACNDGSQVLSKQETVTGGGELAVDESIPNSSVDLLVALAFTKAKLQSFWITSDKAIDVYTNTPGAGVKQVETATVVGTIGSSGAGDAAVIVTAAGMTGSPRTVSVAVADNDTAAQVAGKIATALQADTDVGAWFTVTNPSGAIVRLVAVAAAANDSTMNVDVDNGTCSGLTDEPTSVHTTAGVAPSGADHIALTAGQARQWTANDAPFIPNPFAGDVTELYVTNSSGAAAQLQIRGIVDLT